LLELKIKSALFGASEQLAKTKSPRKIAKVLGLIINISFMILLAIDSIAVLALTLN
jgi:hypothetical protein